MIKAVHTLVYSDDPEATRSFLRDVLGWPYVEHRESGPGWLIFKTGPSEMGGPPDVGNARGAGVLLPPTPLDLADVRRHRGHHG